MMKNPFGELPKKTIICCLCGAILTQTFAGLVCVNPDCRDYLKERHEHVPKRLYVRIDGWGDSVEASGTVASGVSGTRGPINFIEWPNGGGDENG